MFIIPEKTQAGYSFFGDIPDRISFENSEVVVYGVPIDITTSFGKGTSRGPEAIRLTSALQVETFVFEEKKDVHEHLRIYDLGDLRIPVRGQNTNNNNNHYENNSVTATLSFLDKTVPKITSLLYDSNKTPIIVGGEHTLSYYTVKAFAKERPLIIHFDAHRDMKKEYEGKKLCHTTLFFHLINEGYIQGKNIVQIGIRQSDQKENKLAEDNGVVTFDAWDIHKNINSILQYLRNVTHHRKIYISIDIDVYDLPYVPCTGTPEPFGLDPFQVIEIIKSIDETACLIGMDMVEVSLQNNDYREGTLATETLLRILSSSFIKSRI